MKQSRNVEYKKNVAFAGNPNVGKSTIFNELTGLKQHTGNWAGKTVTLAEGSYTYNNGLYNVVDLPGTYSLISSSKEEEVARDYICFGEAEKVVVVCDATCMERNLNLVLQILEITDNVIVCVNLIDEAENKKISVNYRKLSELLGVTVIPVCARKKHGISRLKKEIECDKKNSAFKIIYPDYIEKAISVVEETLKDKLKDACLNTRWTAMKLLCNDISVINSMEKYIDINMKNDDEITLAITKAFELLEENNINKDSFKDKLAAHIVMTAEGIYLDTVHTESDNYNIKDRKIDKIFTDVWISYPLMMALIGIIFWITITGANYPSTLLNKLFIVLENKLTEFAIIINAPEFLYKLLISGVFKVVGWVVSVMLPPMAIFFPLFTIMEDSGLLPRIAFNLDKAFKKCSACGKQSLTMCMGFGCNAVGVTGCRIIDSERERLIGIITNSLVPCNGRFPTIIAIISMFFLGVNTENSVLSALILLFVILLGIGGTFAVSKLLSLTLLKGKPSSYTIELPPFRKPQILKVIVRSVFDRTLFVLGRAVAVAAPAGLVIWLLANIKIGDLTVLNTVSAFLDPFGRLIGLDGVIILAFILGFPANEIVVPIMLMSYLSQGTLIDYESTSALKTIFIDNGWTLLTAINTILFSLFHFPCSTTLITIKKETGSFKWTILAFLIPTLMGVTICALTTFIYNIFI